MGDLNAGHGSLGLEKRRNPLEREGVLPGPDARIPRAYAPFGRNGRGLDHDQGGPTHGTAPQVNHVPVRGQTVFTGILSHGRDENPVAKLDVLDSKG